VYVDGDGNQEIMEQIRDALRRVGYSVATVDARGSTSDDLVLTRRVKDFWFNNFGSSPDRVDESLRSRC
jgi:predicted alpha/beta-fold hydrolase